MNELKKWVAVYTYPKSEKKVAALLTKNNIENFCPLNRVEKKWSDRKKIVLVPLFTSYVFVKISEKEQLDLKKTDGVVNLVYWLNKPAIIPDHEIDAIKHFLNDHTNVSLQKSQINISDKVKVLSGPLFESEGEVLFVKNRTVKIALPSLGYLMYAEVEIGNVELIKDAVVKGPILKERTNSHSLYIAK